MSAKKKKGSVRKKARPRLVEDMSVSDFETYYWMKDDLIAFARELGLPTHGYKPELRERIRRRLRGQPQSREAPRTPSGTPRDSDKPLTSDTPVVNYKSDQRTREFFRSEIGPKFHFTYHVNQFRLASPGLTYGDLIEEWLAERDRRKRKDYKPELAAHGEWNRFVRDFFADERNEGKSLKDAAFAWNKVKPTRDRTYASLKRKGRKSKQSE